ncbi:MAG: aminotransferase class III-fold pyridoxal phosphate-dependent enzyme, partial [Candidatus Acidiferrales bacterium]
RFDFVREVRGEGLILGLDLSIEGGPIVEEALRQGLIINCTHEHILRFLPPFVIRAKQVREFRSTLSKVLAKAPRKAWEPYQAKQTHDTSRTEETAGARAQAAAR